MGYLQVAALFGFFFSINFEVYDPLGTDGAFSISKMMGYIYVLAMAPAIMDFRTPREYRPVLKPVLAFFGLLVVINIFHIRYGHANFYEFSLIQNIILFWILINHERERPMVLEKGMLGFATGSVTLAVLYSFGIGVGYDEDGRVSLFGTNQNEIGILMSISAIYIILMLLQNRGQFGKIRFLYLAGLPFILSLMLATGSRTAFIILLLALTAVIALYKTQSGWVKAVLVFAGVAGLVGLWQYLMNSELVAQRLLETLEDGDLSERDTIWKAVLPVWLGSPFFGVGNTGYEFFCSWYYGRIMSPHNVIIEILILSGMAGLSIYLYFLYRVFRISWKTYRSLGYLVPLLLLLPVAGMLLSGQLLYIKSGWIIFAYITSNALYLSSPESAMPEAYSGQDELREGLSFNPSNRAGE